MPTKFLKPKNMRRGLLALLLSAPLVYMFGSLFFALNGAHNHFPFEQESLINEIELDSTDFNQGTINNTEGYISSAQNAVYSNTFRPYGVSLSLDLPNDFLSYAVFYYDDSNVFISSVVESNENYLRFSIPEGTSFIRVRFQNNPTLNPSEITILSIKFYDTTDESNSDYLFGQFFAKDNWVASLGEKAVNNDTGIGLPFVGDLISYIDENAMPLSNSAYGYFIWGYSSYILNVLAIYMVVSIAASLVLIPMKVVDSLEERING